MKKLLLSLLLVGACMGASAQRANVYSDNTLFMSFNVGASLYNHSGSSDFSLPTGGLSFGRWLMRPLAFRIAADVTMTPSFAQTGKSGSATYLFGSAEFLWDINSTFFHVYNKTFLYPIPFYPLIGLGVVYRPSSDFEGESYGEDNDFQAMLGLHMPVRLGSSWDAFLEYKCFFLPQTFDKSPNDNFLQTFTLGLTHRWGDNPFARRTQFESRSTDEDWFVGFGIGASFSSFEFEFIDNIDARLWNVSPEFMIGRNYSNVWTIRFELSGFFARERAHITNDSFVDAEGQPYTKDVLHPGNWYIFNCLHTDFMINLSHLAGFDRGVKWNFLPYMGAGPVWRYQDHPVFTVAADAGLFIRRYVDNMSDIYFDLKYIMVPPRVAGETGPSGSIFGVGYPMITFGYIYNFDHSTARYRMPVNSDIN